MENPSKPLKETFNHLDHIGIKTLIDTALGRTKADLVVSHADLVNVYSGELLHNQSVAVKGDRIAFVSEKAEHTIGPDTRVIDAAGKVLIPGLIDPHIHPVPLFNIHEFLKYAMKTGTTTIITETVELVLPLGYQGVRQFLKSISGQPIKIFATVGPVLSMSPAAQSNFLRPEMLRRFLRQKNVLGLGETSWPFVLEGDERILRLYAGTLNAGKSLEGHAAGARGNNLQAYVAAGISSCHEPTTVDEVLERVRLGLHAMIREGIVRRDLEAVAGIKDKKIDFRRLVLCTDGVNPKHMREHGYMEFVVQRAIDLGFDPVTAIQMATLNAAEHFHLDSVIGGIAPGRYADMMVIPDLRKIQPEMVISNGRIIAERGQLLVPPRKHIYPKSALKIVSLPVKLEPPDFQVRVPEKDKPVTVRVISQVTGLVTREEQLDITPENGLLKADPERDILKVAFIDRSGSPGRMFTGFIKGFGLKTGAFASSAAWELSGIIVVGVKDADMAGAVNRIIDLGGGAVVYAEGSVMAELPLPVAGFISDLPEETESQRYNDIQQKATQLGTSLPDAYTALTTLTTSVIPFLRICEAGLMDIKKRALVDLIV